MSFFGVGGGNPFATPVGQKIELATDSSLPSENWALNMEICDIINATDDGAKDAIKAIRKRLQQNVPRNYTVVMYTLTVLETCVKNCDRRFHVLACNKEFVQELVKLIGPKFDPPTAVQEKVLSLIQSWADAFRNQPEMSGVSQMYQELKQKGIQFPMTDLDTMAPIHTPQRAHEPQPAEGATQSTGVTVGGGATPPLPHPSLAAPAPGTGTGPVGSASAAQEVAPTQNIILTPEQTAKLQSELDVVQANMAVLNEMLTELTPGQEHPSDLELLTELHSTCHAMQQRLVYLIGKLASDELTAELLRINDLLNNLFLRYSRFKSSREPRKEKPSQSLIDLEEPVSQKELSSQLSALSMSGAGATAATAATASVAAAAATASAAAPAATTTSAQAERIQKDSSDFDMFAQSRNVSYESTKAGGSTYQDNLKPNQVSGSLAAVAAARGQAPSPQEQILGMHKESDFDEMAAWLGDTPAEESLTSSEFERFLAERAAAGERGTAAGDAPAVNSPSRNAGSGDRSRTQRHKKEEEAALFGL